MMVKPTQACVFKAFTRKSTPHREEPMEQGTSSSSAQNPLEDNGLERDEQAEPTPGPSQEVARCHDLRNGQQAPFTESMHRLKECQWYWGAISAKEANRLLETQPPGTFLVRDSRSENYIFSLSYKTETGVYHSRLARHNGRYCLGGPNSLISSPSLVDFIEETVKSSTDKRILMHPSSVNPRAEPVQVKFPLSRRQMLPSLKYMCRLVIRHSTRDINTIQNLPVPRKIKKFLGATNYMMVC